ncbi:uncharacterized protein LOC135694057 [Rhopilema esculentum]|uniref:uncharacterized protein LOC135694057 n=1 Tax=Rhopilema esculentum TaxID=499914 RepID=UPI0031E48150
MNKQEKLIGSVTVPEILSAERLWIINAQAVLKQDPKFELLKKQLGIGEQSGILRCVGRLSNSDMEFESKFPIILPKNHRFTELVVLHVHALMGHEGLRITLTELRSRFWITKGREFIKKLIKPCIICKKLEGKAYKAPLPNFRVQESPPFSKVGVDFAGPLYVKGLKGKTHKTYIALSSCCVTRALHLELVEDLTAQSFLRCLRRFTARRGTPELIVSDNAKTFKAAAKSINRIFRNKDIQQELESRRKEWKFNLERSPWWGGMFERMVGLVKCILRKILGNALLNKDEMHTVLVEVEGILNSRPLTYIYEDDFNVDILTPSHLMFGSLVGLAKLCSLCNSIWKHKHWPNDWLKSVFITIPKKGDATLCKNNRTIVLISHTSKILLYVIVERMRKRLDEELPATQAEELEIKYPISDESWKN